jgi:alpha-tubulin suppressor-like RCC1 family protein
VSKASARKRLVMLSALIVALVASTNAQAYWISNGWGSGIGNVGTLAAPTNVQGTPGAGTVGLTWSSVTPPGSGTVTYNVKRGGAAVSGCQALSGTTCTDSGLVAGTYSYTVTAVWRTWTATSSPISVPVASGAFDHFKLEAATTTPTAGQADNLKITAQDAAGVTVTAYAASPSLTFACSGACSIGSFNPTVIDSGGQVRTFGQGTTISFTGGVAQVTGSSNGVMTLYKAGAASISVNDGAGHTGSLSVNAKGAPISKFSLSGATAVSAGATDNLTITALDQYGNTASYAGSHNLTFSCTGDCSIGSYNPTINGVSFSTSPSISFSGGGASGTMILYKAGAASITVSEGGSYTSTALSVTVSAAAINKFSLSGATAVSAGATDNLTITALDQYGNTTNYSDSHNLTFSGAASIGSNNPTVTNSSAGAIAFGAQTAITFTNGVSTLGGVMRLYKAEAANVTVSESGSYTSTALSVTVSAAAINKFSLSGATAVTAGATDNLTITALDQYGNTTSYAGPHNLTFSCTGDCSIGSYNPTINGVSFSTSPSISFSGGGASGTMILYKAGAASITVSEGASYNSSPLSVTVNGAGINRFSLAAATTTPRAGQADNLTITALDQYGNTASYSGSPNLTFSGATAIGTFTPTVTNTSGVATNFLTATAITFTNGVATVSGSANGVMRLYRAQTQTVNIVVSDGSHTNGTGLAVTVSAGAPGSFTVSNPGTRTAGTAFNVTLTALADAYGNAPTNYTGTQCLTFSGPTASPNGTAPLYPTQGSCGAGQNAVTFTSGSTATVNITLYDATNSTTITATDAPSGAHGTSGAFAVNGLTTMSTFVLTAATTTPTAGAGDTLTITAGDTWGNTVTSYKNNHNLTFSGASVSGSGTAPTVTNRNGTATAFGATTSITFTNGVSTAGGAMRLYAAETVYINVTDGTHTNGTELQVTVAPAAMSAFSLSAKKTVVTAGLPDNLTITAIDQYGNTAPSYTGSHNLTFAGANLSGTIHPTVTNSSGTATNFGVATAITFANGVATVDAQGRNGVMRLYRIERARITVSEGALHELAPLYVAVSATATAVSAGAFHTCALMPYGGIECWGNNDYGQLGDNTTTDRSTPIIVGGITTATQISSGKYHTCALLADHTIRCWGRNNYGQLGDGTTTDRHTPVQVTGITNAVQVSDEGGITCALLATGSVRCWGHNAYGQLGNGLSGEANNSSTPVQVSGITSATAIGTGANHACALLSADTVYCWGLNDNGQLGDNTLTARSTPVQVRGVGNVGVLTGVASISAGRYHVCAVLTTGRVDCWGSGDYGALGDGATTDRATPVEAGGITTAVEVSGGAYHTCVRLTDGTGECWGRNNQGQLGDGTTTLRMSPAAIVGVDGTGVLADIAQISSGGGNGTGDYEHTCALTSDQTVYCWGYNNYGQVGDTTTTTRLFAVGVALQ